MTGRELFDFAVRAVRLALRSILLVLTAGISLGFLLSAWSPEIPPVRFTLPALLGLAFPVFLLALSGATLYWLIRWRWRVLIALALVWIGGWGAVSTYLPINRLSSAPTEGEGKLLKVITYNVAAWGFVPHSKSQPNPILQYVRSSGADLICIQEAMLSDTAWGPLSSAQVRSSPSDLYPHISIGLAQHRGSVIILLSKYPILESERIALKSRTNGAFRYTIDLDGKPITLLNVHLESFHLSHHDGENYLALARDANARGLKQALTAKLGPAYRARNIQVNLLRNIIDKAGDDALVCGDFNDTPISYAHRKLSEGLQDVFAKRGNGLGFSYQQGLFAVRIDHILAGKRFTPLSASVDKSIGLSDHYPVLTTLRVNP